MSETAGEESWLGSDADISLSPRAWSSSSTASPSNASPTATPPSATTHSYSPKRSFSDLNTDKDCFIADKKALEKYLR